MIVFAAMPVSVTGGRGTGGGAPPRRRRALLVAAAAAARDPRRRASNYRVPPATARRPRRVGSTAARCGRAGRRSPAGARPRRRPTGRRSSRGSGRTRRTGRPGGRRRGEDLVGRHAAEVRGRRWRRPRGSTRPRSSRRPRSRRTAWSSTARRGRPAASCWARVLGAQQRLLAEQQVGRPSARSARARCTSGRAAAGGRRADEREVELRARSSRKYWRCAPSNSSRAWRMRSRRCARCSPDRNAGPARPAPAGRSNASCVVDPHAGDAAGRRRGEAGGGGDRGHRGAASRVTRCRAPGEASPGARARQNVGPPRHALPGRVAAPTTAACR